MNKIIIVIITVGIIILGNACTNPFNDGSAASKSTNTAFNYETTDQTSLIIKGGLALAGFQIYSEDSLVLQGFFNEEGAFEGQLNLASYITEVELRTAVIGLPSFVVLTENNNRFFHDYSAAASESSQIPLAASNSAYSTSTDFQTLGSWNSSGVPNYLDGRDVLSTTFLSELNAALPEYQPVPDYRPQYLNGKETEVHLLEEAEVWVTFIHEGAGYRNTLAYYTYPTEQGIPGSLADGDLTIIFPNVSYSGSGGGLISGDKVHIGRFPAGTSIGWVLIANGYSTTIKDVTNGNNRFYSYSDFNPDSAGYRQHVVQIDFEERVVLSFEDLRRPGGDNDFNDAVFSVTSNPITAIDNSQLVSKNDTAATSSPGGTTSINESVILAATSDAVHSISYSPAKGEFGTLAYEDLWPYMGDYDFNDLVIDYNWEESFNADGEIIALKGTFAVKGIVASMRNGFAVELGIDPSAVASVTGYSDTVGYMKLAANGVEERQDYAVIPVFEDANANYSPQNIEYLVITVRLSHGVTREELGFAPYNPFIMSNGERGREVHLPGKPQTDLAHFEYFGSFDDYSILGTDYMYKTVDEQPWAIHLPVSFRYPQDDVHIANVYNHFTDWVESRGVTYEDWYVDKPGYRNTGLLFY